MSDFEYFERTMKVLAIVAIPVVVAIVGYLIRAALQTKELARDYTKLAIGLLQDQETSKHLRYWAIEVLNSNSEIKLPPEAIVDLAEGRSKLPRSIGSIPRELFREPAPIVEKTGGEVLKKISKGLATIDHYLEREVRAPGWRGTIVEVSEPSFEADLRICVSAAIEEKDSGVKIYAYELHYSEDWIVGAEAAFGGLISSISVKDRSIELGYERSWGDVVSPPQKIDVTLARAADLLRSPPDVSDSQKQHWVRTPSWTGILREVKTVSNIEHYFRIEESGSDVIIHVTCYEVDLDQQYGQWEVGDSVRAYGRIKSCSPPNSVELDFGVVDLVEG